MIHTKHSLNDLTGFRRDLLYVIASLDAPYGLAIKTELEEYYSQKIQHGRLYPNLDTLVEKELVNKGHHDDRTNAYTLTERGHREIQAAASGKTNTYSRKSELTVLLLRHFSIHFPPDGTISRPSWIGC